MKLYLHYGFQNKFNVLKAFSVATDFPYNMEVHVKSSSSKVKQFSREHIMCNIFNI